MEEARTGERVADRLVERVESGDPIAAGLGPGNAGGIGAAADQHPIAPEGRIHRRDRRVPGVACIGVGARVHAGIRVDAGARVRAGVRARTPQVVDHGAVAVVGHEFEAEAVIGGVELEPPQ